MNATLINKYITVKRLSVYNDISDYSLNLKESKKYYIPLSILEVSLRNSINDLFEKFYGTGWLINEAQFLRADLIAKIVDAKAKLTEKNEQITKDKLVAELTFGFWTALFQSPYQDKMRLNHLKLIFPSLPNKNVIFIDRKIISSKLNHIRKFRNRIFHYEKIINKSEFVNIENDIYEILSYFDNKIFEFTKELNK